MASEEKKVSMRRCQTCGQDLTGLDEGAVCPKCGPARDRGERPRVEMLRIAEPEVGRWSVQVAGAAVNQGRQGYALIASGALRPRRLRPPMDRPDPRSPAVAVESPR